MQRTRIVLLTLALSAAAMMARDARAGVVIVTESETPASAKGAPPAKPGGSARSSRDADETKYSGRLLIQGNHVRMQGTTSEGGEESHGTVLFQTEPEALVVLNGEQKSYFEMTRADAKRLGSAIDAARTQMLAQMEKMTPEQRAAFADALDGFGAGDLAKGSSAPKAPPEPARAVATGGSDTISGHPCRGYDIMRGTRKLAETCVASWADLGLEAADVEGLRKLAAFQQQLFAEVNLGGMDAAPGVEAFEVMDQIKGLPLRVRSLADPKRPVVMRVISVEHKEIDPKVFQIPPGYTKRSTPAG